jgi:2,4-didehydro-3-deoxy-L-rhamnonate hydrolase
MKLANINGRAAIITNDANDATNNKAVDIAAASAGAFGPTMQEVLASWTAFVAWASTATLPGSTLPDGVAFRESDLDAPSPSPSQVFAIGLNYRAHAAEGGRDVPKAPAVFTKFASCLGRPFDDVQNQAGRHDYEAELVIIIGKHAYHVSEADAWSYVAGVTCGQDYSERDTQNASGGHFSLGKSFPGFGPTGPWLVTTDELANPDDLAISCEVSGEIMQSSRTSNMVFSVPVLIAHLSSVTPLLPGDIIFTGTPEGVGFARNPPRLLSAGDVVVTTIEGIGTIRQTITAAR